MVGILDECTVILDKKFDEDVIKLVDKKDVCKLLDDEK